MLSPNTDSPVLIPLARRSSSKVNIDTFPVSSTLLTYYVDCKLLSYSGVNFLMSPVKNPLGSISFSSTISQ